MKWTQQITLLLTNKEMKLHTEFQKLKKNIGSEKTS